VSSNVTRGEKTDADSIELTKADFASAGFVPKTWTEIDLLWQPVRASREQEKKQAQSLLTTSSETSQVALGKDLFEFVKGFGFDLADAFGRDAKFLCTLVQV